MELIDEIIDNGDQFFSSLKENDKSRYKSWEYCYKEFQKAHKLEVKIEDDYIEYLSLQLAFYLASWGMYRASSFLLEADYKIHIKTVRELLKPKYNELWAIKAKDLIEEGNINKLNDLQENLRKIYREYRNRIRGDKIKKDISETLITKILLGTMGCVPAYDRFFKDGVRKYKKIATSSFNSNSIKSLALFYDNKKNYEKFEKLREEISNYSKIEYPQMKIIDSCFWQIGYNLNKSEGK